MPCGDVSCGHLKYSEFVAMAVVKCYQNICLSQIFVQLKNGFTETFDRLSRNFKQNSDTKSVDHSVSA